MPKFDPLVRRSRKYNARPAVCISKTDLQLYEYPITVEGSLIYEDMATMDYCDTDFEASGFIKQTAGGFYVSTTGTNNAVVNVSLFYSFTPDNRHLRIGITVSGWSCAISTGAYEFDDNSPGVRWFVSDLAAQLNDELYLYSFDVYES